MQWLSALAILTSISSGMVSPLPQPDHGTPQGLELLILHNNDMHARFEQTSRLSGVCSPEERDAGTCYGGFPRVAHVVKTAREQARNRTGPQVLYLNAGDTYTGTPWFTIYKWKIAAECLNSLHPDAVSLGNHEFDETITGLTPFVRNLQSPVLVSNLLLDNIPELAVQPNLHKSIVLNVNGTKVGIIGYLTPDTVIDSITKNLKFVDEIVAIKEQVAILQNEDVKILIALGHSGWTKDLEIAREVEGIDLVIGGHTNTFLWNGTAPDAEEIQGPYPTMVRQSSGRMVPVVQAYAYTKYLGKLHIVLDAGGEIVSYDGSPILLDSSIPNDPTVLKIIEGYREGVTNFTGEVIGETSVLIDGDTCRLRECNMGNMITDAMVFKYASEYNVSSWTDPVVAFVQGGSIRSSIAKPNKPGKINYGDLMTVMPFGTKIILITVNGTVLLQVLEHSVAHYSPTEKHGEFLQHSGIQVTYDLSQGPGNRVVKAKVRCVDCRSPKYIDIVNDQEYKILANGFMADGGDGYTMFKGLPSIVLDYDELESSKYYIRKNTPVNPELEGRIKLLNKGILLHQNNMPLNKGQTSSALRRKPLTGLALITAVLHYLSL